MKETARLTDAEIEKLLEDIPELEWRVDFGVTADDSQKATLRLGLGVEREFKIRQRQKQIERFHTPLLASALVMTGVALFHPMGVSVGLAAFCWTVFGFSIAKVSGLSKAAEDYRSLRQRLSRAGALSVYLESDWIEAMQADRDINALVVDWMLVRREVNGLGRRIERGLEALENLSPADPLQGSMRIEIEALQSRRAMILSDSRQRAETIGVGVRHYIAEKRMREDARRRRQLQLERDAEYQRQVCRIASQEQAKLDSQERAQGWLDSSD